MHTVDLLNESLQAARGLGYEARFEWLGGTGGGACEIHGRRWIFLDLALAPAEHLQLVQEVLSFHAARQEANEHPAPSPVLPPSSQAA
jgi:hypothetical protein